MAADEANAGSTRAERPKREPGPRDPRWDGVEATTWTDRMISALENGVEGGKWFSLADKAIRPATLEAAGRKVQSNKGARASTR